MRKKTARRLILTGVMIVTLWATGTAQSIFGLRGSVGLSTGINNRQETASDMLAWKAGAYLYIGVTENFFIEPALVFEQSGTKIKNTPLGDLTAKPCYVGIPLMLGFNLPTGTCGAVRFKAGPYFAYGIAGDARYEQAGKNTTKNIFEDDIYRKIDMGGAIGIDYKTPIKIIVGIEAKYGFIDVNTIDNYNKGIHNLAMFFTLGYDF